MDSSRYKRKITALIISSLGLVCALPSAFAQNSVQNNESGSWSVYANPYTLHYSDAEKENEFEPDAPKHAYVWGLGVEKQIDPRYLGGLFFFNNSFGQKSQYLYAGAKFTPLDSTPQLFVKVTGGVIHGYKYPYHKKIPVNTRSGWGLGIIPAVGWTFSKNLSAQVNLLGTAGIMTQVSYHFD